MNIAEQYIQDVISGKIPACEYVKLAINRHLADLKRNDLMFSEEKAMHAINFFSFLRHFKGLKAGERFELSPWQAFVIYNLFGWYRKDGRRRYNYAYIEVAKKNGKSTFAAGIGLYMMLADGEIGAEVYSAATNYKQASIVFDTARNLVKKSEFLSKYLTVYRYNIHSEDMISKFEALSSDSDRQDGLNPHCAIIDEYHAHKTDELINNVKSGIVGRRNPLVFIITTAGFNKERPCYYERKVCIDILRGIKEQDNKFAIIYTLDEGDDWMEPSNWIKANPNLGISVDVEKIMEEYKSAKNNEREIVNFKTKNLNIWTSSSIAWIKDEDWVRCDKSPQYDPKSLLGKKCYGGLDLASHVDITALALLFQDGEINHLLCFFWVPEEKVIERGDYVDYQYWAAKNYIRKTKGKVIDIDALSHDILEICKLYDVQSIAIDPAKAYHGVVQNLVKNEIKLSHFRQGFISMDAPTKEFEKMILGEQINHFGNPVLRWMCSNVELSQDPAGNIKVNKSKSIDKVDGIVASIMAIGEWMTFRSVEEDKFEIKFL